MRTREVKVNDRGRRIGESHPRAKLTDHEIELIRELVEQGLTYRQVVEKLAKEHGIVVGRADSADRGRRYIAKIARYEKRAQLPARIKRVLR